MKSSLDSNTINSNFQYKLNHALTGLKASPQRNHQDFLRLWEIYKEDMNCVNLSTIMNILGNIKNEKVIRQIRLSREYKEIVDFVSEKLRNDPDWFDQSQVNYNFDLHTFLPHLPEKLTLFAFSTLALSFVALLNQALTNVLYTFAKLIKPKISNAAALDVTASDDIDPRAYSALKHEGETSKWKGNVREQNGKIYAIFSYINTNFASKIASGGAQEVALTVWSYAILKLFAPNIFNAVVENRERLVEDCNPQELSLICWSFARNRHDSPELFDLVACKPEKILAGGPQVISNVAWSFASNNMRADDMFASIAGRLDMLLMEGKPQALSNTMWAFAMMGIYEGDVVSSLWDALVNCTEEEMASMKHELYVQMYQVTIAASIEAPHLVLAPPPPKMNKIVQTATTRNTDVLISKSQKHVSNILHRMGFYHKLEVSPMGRSDGFLSLDMADTKNSIAVEFDGPFHYVRREGLEHITNRDDGRTAFKTRLLERKGWRIIRVSYLDWAGLSNEEEQIGYLFHKLKEVMDI